VTEKKGYYSIGNVERDTGIGRDTLRIWERRYGFPEPARNDKGERIYSEAQVRRLQRIRRLLDQGMRPGKLLVLAEPALEELEASLLPASLSTGDASVDAMIDSIRSADAEQLETLLRQRYKQQDMQGFIVQTVVPLLEMVGDLWAGGQLQIFQEHFLSQQLIRFINAEVASVEKSTSQPRVLLATLPGEEHTLGLLMVVAILAASGRHAINLGGEVPMDQITQAVQQFHVDVVGITFSGAYQYANIRSHLFELRALLPENVQIWTGGEGVRRLRNLPTGITKFSSLEKLPL
jgi:DNA-binding transcriptional MerR regulator